MPDTADKPQMDTCNSCGKLFPRVRMRLCGVCALDEQQRFQLVRTYLIENDGASIRAIARSTGVGAGEVSRFLDSGRLVRVRPHLREDLGRESA